ncbi:MAG: hypothetical protein ACFB16_11760 [Phormidesmis sp.]
MDAGLLRTIWSVIEETPAYYLQRVSPGEQVRLLLKRVENKVMLSAPERVETHQYLHERRTMIREMSLEQVM